MEMRLVPSTVEMAGLDQCAQEKFHIPGIVLMERAAIAVLDLVVRRNISGPFVVLAGGGNNGGDAFALARLLLQSGQSVEVFAFRSESGRISQSNQIQRSILEALGLAVHDISGSPDSLMDPVLAQALLSCACLIDGLCGIGQKGALQGIGATLAKGMQQGLWGRPLVIALDVPSGIHDAWVDDQPVVPAGITCCFGFAKQCLYTMETRRFAGEIVVLDIGFPRGLAGESARGPWLLQTVDMASLLPSFAPDIHKYDRGTTSIFAGSPDYLGAPMLCARAAANSRSGMVRLCLDPAVHNLFAAQAGSLVFTSSESLSGDAVVIGPGWGRSTDRVAQLTRLLSQAAAQKIGVVLDADALVALASPDFPCAQFVPTASDSWILTPHAAELSQLLACPIAEILHQPHVYACQAARRWSATVILKGAVTWIAQPDGSCFILDAANPILAEAGSGDVLAGICGTILGQLRRQGQLGQSACGQAARAAVLVLAAAGEKLASQKRWATAEELISVLPAVFADFSPPLFRKTIYTGAVGSPTE